MASWKASGNPSPKNTISGFIIPCETKSENREISLEDIQRKIVKKFSNELHTSEIIIWTDFSQRGQSVGPTFRTNRNSLSEYIFPNVFSADLIFAFRTGSCSERAVAFDDVFNASDLFECINILGIISQQFLVFFQHFDEPVTGARLELPGVDFPSEFEKRTRILAEVIDVEHCLEHSYV